MLMRKAMLIISVMLVVMVRTATASYVTVNIDRQTNAAMTESYGVSSVIEAKNTRYLEQVLNHYKDINLSTAGIFAQKWLERKALTNVGLLATQENYYYHHIGNMVINHITPGIVNCARLLVKEPQNALYWGPWLIRTTSDVTGLCNVFTTVVANGKLRFEDIPGWVLLSVNPDFAKIVDLANIGSDTDWDDFFDDIGDFGKGLSANDIIEDVKNIGQSIAIAGRAVLDRDLMEASKLGHVFKSTPNDIIRMVKYFKEKYKSYKEAHSVRDVVQAFFGDDPKTVLTKLFVSADLKTADYMESYLNSFTGTYYRQRWYIYGGVRSNEVYEDYFDSQRQSLATFRKHMEAERDKLEAERDYRNGQEGVAAYYVIGSDDPVYYTVPDDRKLNGCSSVNFIANCKDEQTIMMDGDFDFKRCRTNHDGKGLKLPEDESDAMGNNGASTGANDPSKALMARKAELTKEINDLYAKRNAIFNQLTELQDQIRQAQLASDSEKVARLNAEYRKLNKEQSDIYDKINYLKSHREDPETGDMSKAGLDQIEEALKSYKDDISDVDGDSYRIQDIMNKLQTVFDLSWDNGGDWVTGSDNAVFTRTAYCGQTKTTVTFTAKLTAARRYKKFFGMRIHRELLKVSYKLTGGAGGETVVKSMQLDPDSSQAEANKRKVEDEMSKLQQDYPDCEIRVEYFYQQPQDADDGGEEPLHLLWVGDRVRIAQEIDSRLIILNADIMLLYRSLQEHESLMDFFKRALGNAVNRARRATIAQICYGDWCQNFMSTSREWGVATGGDDSQDMPAKRRIAKKEALKPEEEGGNR